jgi:sugar diacid utilization regulator
VLAGAEVLGSVWASAPPEEAADRRSLLEQATRVIALELLRQRSIAEAESQRHSELLDELLSGRAATLAMLRQHAADFGIDLARPHLLAVAAVRARDGDAQSPTARRGREALIGALRHAVGCPFAAEHAGHVVALLEPDAQAPTAELRRAVALAEQEGAIVRVVVSASCEEAPAYRAAFAVADRTLALLGDALAEPVTELGRLRVLALLFRDGGAEEARAFVQGCLGAVLAHGEQRGELIRTLEAYLEAGGSPARAARALHVHVNTVYYRLERLRELLGEDFADPRRAVDLQVALLARRLLL